MFEVYCSNSLIYLKDGQRIYCENHVPEVEKMLKDYQPNDIILLFPSDLEGESISVYAKEILKCEYTD